MASRTCREASVRPRSWSSQRAGWWTQNAAPWRGPRRASGGPLLSFLTPSPAPSPQTDDNRHRRPRRLLDMKKWTDEYADLDSGNTGVQGVQACAVQGVQACAVQLMMRRVCSSSAPCALGALRAPGAFGALGVLGAFSAFSAPGALGVLDALSALGAPGALGVLGAFAATWRGAPCARSPWRASRRCTLGRSSRRASTPSVRALAGFRLKRLPCASVLAACDMQRVAWPLRWQRLCVCPAMVQRSRSRVRSRARLACLAFACALPCAGSAWRSVQRLCLWSV